MFFRRALVDRHDSASSLPDAPPVSSARAIVDGVDMAPLLDAFGQMLAAYAQGSFDLPDVTSVEAGAELERWRRHTVLGVPLEPSDGTPSVSAAQRDYPGAALALTDHRRREKRYVESALADLRAALWACVERVHTVAQADQLADQATTIQIDRVQTAIHGIETHAVKDEVLQAVAAMTEIARSRRQTQQDALSMLAQRIDQLGSQLEEARRDSETDALTGLGNRKRFESAAQRAVQMHTLHRAPLSLVAIDLDHLKQINDGYGHAAGDATLQAIAHALSKVFLGDSDVVCRLGGDEFVVVLAGIDEHVAARLAARAVQHIASIRPPFAADAPALSVSVGYATYRGHEGVDAWLARADAALYRAKQDGRGRASGAN